MYQPLFGGSKKSEKSDPDILKKMREVGDKQSVPEQPKIPVPQEQPKLPPVSSNPVQATLASNLEGIANIATKSNTQLNGFIEDNKNLIGFIVVIIILLILAYIIYNQQKQRRAIKELSKRMMKMRAK